MRLFNCDSFINTKDISTDLEAVSATITEAVVLLFPVVVESVTDDLTLIKYKSSVLLILYQQ